MESKPDKKRILVLHGFLHSARRYQRLKKDLETLVPARVTVYEFPGFGSTPGKYRKQIMLHYQQDLCKYLRENRFDCIIGHSMGGNLALRAAAENCSRESLILLSPEYGGIPLIKPFIVLKPIVRHCLELLKKDSRLHTFLIKLMSLVTINRFSLIDPQIVRDVQRADAHVASQLMFELAWDRWKLKKGQTPLGQVTLITGERDRLIPKTCMEELKNILPNCRSYVLRGIGHTAVAEDYEGLLRLLLGAL